MLTTLMKLQIAHNVLIPYCYSPTGAGHILNASFSLDKGLQNPALFNSPSENGALFLTVLSDIT